MLMSTGREKGASRGTPVDDDDGFDFNFDRLWAIARRQYPIFLLACALGLALGLVYVLTAVPLYTARTHIMVDNRPLRVVEDVSGVTGLGTDVAAIDSEVEVLRSEQIGLRVVERLRLYDEPTFLNPPGGNFFSAAFGLMRGYADPRSWFAPEGEQIVVGEETRRRIALQRLQGSLQVRRLGRTYVLEVAYTSHDRGEAARLANAVANAYLTDQLDSRFESTRRAGDWLQQRIAELQKQTRESDLAIQRFRAENNLIVADGSLVSERQLSELSSQLILARAETAQARARYNRIQAIMDAGQTDAIVGEALDQAVFDSLRASYLEASRRAADLSDRLGPEHAQVLNLRNQMQEYERLIFEELRRIAQSYLSDYEVARSREEALQEGLDAGLGVTAKANEALVELRELESRAGTYRSLLDNFQRRFEEATQQQSFPITDARIITAASTPQFKSYPSSSRALAFYLMLGAAVGAGIGLLREYSDRAFRTGAQVREELEAEFLGMLPLIDGKDSDGASDDAAALLEQRRFAVPAIMRYSLDNPLSGFAETLRSAKVAADIALQDDNSRIIGVVSTLPGEGKSTTSINLAALLASQGKRTLLIDADMRNPGLTRNVAPLAERGLVDVLLHQTPFTDLLLEEVASGLHFLPCVIKTRISHTADLIASPAMKGLLREAARSYDYVIVDCPPLNPVVDVRAAAASFDGFVYVVEWGRTARAAVRNTLMGEAQVYERCLGVVLNKADKARLAAYEGEGSKDYYYSRYSSYYQK